MLGYSGGLDDLANSRSLKCIWYLAFNLPYSHLIAGKRMQSQMVCKVMPVPLLYEYEYEYEYEYCFFIYKYGTISVTIIYNNKYDSRINPGNRYKDIRRDSLTRATYMYIV